MQYIKVNFSFTKAQEYQKDLLINELGNIGYDTFEETPEGFAAFTDKDHYSEQNLAETLAGFKEDALEYSYHITEIAGENWNEEWEKNFEPLTIDNKCYVRATFHEPRPQYLYEIIIDPKMAFGTGHHQTTTMMMQYILSFDMKDKEVLDMGCGTGILAILASKRGALALTAIDNDETCYNSTLENLALNQVNNTTAIWGGKEVIPEQSFDLILANINRNILLNQIPEFVKVLKPGGSIFFSGFYESPDLEMINTACRSFGLNYADHKKIGEWVAAHFKK